MKIAIDISQVAYGTGVASYTTNLVKTLLKIDKKNQYVLLGYSLRKAKPLRELIDSLSKYKNFEFKFFPIPVTVASIFGNSLRLYPWDKLVGEVDIFHSSDWIQPLLKANNIKKVTTVHDMTPFLFENSTHPKILRNQKRRINIVKNEVDLIFADSQTTKDDLVKFGNISEEKVKVVYLGVSSQFNPQDDEKINKTLEKYKIKKPYILSVSTQEPRKNIQKLVDVFKKLNIDNPNLSLVLIGKYGWGNQVESVPNVKSTGFVPQEDLVALYSGARVFVYPSLYEGFGLPLLEAMACGVPTITSNNSSMAEIAKDAAILVDPRSDGQIKKAIEIVINLNLENYQKMVRASMDRARAYTWTKTAREVLASYEELSGLSQ